MQTGTFSCFLCQQNPSCIKGSSGTSAPSDCCGPEQFSEALLKTGNIILRMAQELEKQLIKAKLATTLTWLCLSSLIQDILMDVQLQQLILFFEVSLMHLFALHNCMLKLQSGQQSSSAEILTPKTPSYMHTADATLRTKHILDGKKLQEMQKMHCKICSLLKTR